MRRHALLLLTLCAGMLAQDPRPEIRGVVTEYATLVPIPEVEISVMRMPENSFTRKPPEVIAKTITDANGAFHLELGDFAAYVITAAEADWSPVGNPLRLSERNNSVTVSLDKEHPRREVNFRLARESRITGRVLDDDTGEPLKDRLVVAWRVSYQEGRRVLLPVLGTRMRTAGLTRKG